MRTIKYHLALTDKACFQVWYIVLIAELNYTFVQRKVLNEIKNFGDAQITKAAEVNAKFTISEIYR